MDNEKAREAAWKLFAKTGDPAYYEMYVSLRDNELTKR